MRVAPTAGVRAKTSLVCQTNSTFLLLWRSVGFSSTKDAGHEHQNGEPCGGYDDSQIVRVGMTRPTVELTGCVKAVAVVPPRHSCPPDGERDEAQEEDAHDLFANVSLGHSTGTPQLVESEGSIRHWPVDPELEALADHLGEADEDDIIGERRGSGTIA